MKEVTYFETIYDSFLGRITDSMYLEMDEIDTFEQLQQILLNAIPRFKLPRIDIYDYEEGAYGYLGTYCGVESNYKEVEVNGWIGGQFNVSLSKEEINILSLGMVIEWLILQLNTTELYRMKFSGADFKLTSQANHMAKLKVMIDKYESEFSKLRDIYKRQLRNENGIISSTLGDIMKPL